MAVLFILIFEIGLYISFVVKRLPGFRLFKVLFLIIYLLAFDNLLPHHNSNTEELGFFSKEKQYI